MLPPRQPREALAACEMIMFVDRRSRFASVSQAELAAAEADEGLPVYRISLEGRSGGRGGRETGLRSLAAANQAAL